jgi:hypothetical protein
MNEHELLSLMSALDQGTNMFGHLKPEIRARLFAAVDNPTDETWTDAHGIMVSDGRFMTLWQACLRFTDYPVRRGPVDGGRWESIPTRDQLVTALTRAVAPRA